MYIYTRLGRLPRRAGAEDNPVQTFLQGREDMIRMAARGNSPFLPLGSSVLGAVRAREGTSIVW